MKQPRYNPELDDRNPDEVHADLYRQISKLRRSLIKSNLGWMVTSIAVLWLLLAGCTPVDTDPNPVPTGVPAPERTPSGSTKVVCDTAFAAYRGDTLDSAGTKTLLMNMVGEREPVGNVDGRVRDAIINGLYAGGTIPSASEDIEHRWNLVLSACRRTGWN